MDKRKRILCFALSIMLIFSTVSVVFAVDWDGSSLPIKPGGSSGTATPPDGKANKVLTDKFKN